MDSRTQQPRAAPDPATARIAAAFHAGDMVQVVALAATARERNETVLLLHALALHALQRNGEAAATLRRLVQVRPGVPEYWNNLGVVAREAGAFDEAEQACRRAIELAPHDAQFHHNLGLLYAQQQRWPDARTSQFEAVRLAPGFVEARLQGALACHTCGDVPGEDAMLQGVAQWPPQPAEQALMLADILTERGETATALDVLDQAVLPPDAEGAARMAQRFAAQRSRLFERSNRLVEAQAELATIPLDALPGADAGVANEIMRARAQLLVRQGDHAGAAGLWQTMLDRAQTPSARAGAAFGLAAALDKLQRPGEALAAIRVAHAAQLETLRHIAPRVIEDEGRSLPMAAQRVSHREHDAWSTLPPPRTEQSPVFVVGFPRSGTTLLEQMIDAHPDFRSMDERAFVYDLIERMEQAGQPYPAGLAAITDEEARMLREIYDGEVAQAVPDLGARRLVDKNPLNMLALPMILRLYPEARIVLCLRHPCDVILSCYLLPFRSPPFAALCSSLPRLARGYVAAFEQWFAHAEVFAPRVLEWRYESVVERFDEHVLRLGHFLGIADTEPLKHYAEHARNKGYISTPSYAQVTQGINRRSVDRWQAYREAFDAVLPILKPMLERLGYEV
ncbi:MAG: sulfotransferase [Rudaea sp.]|uniref:tetratricopeptide repeat-containing sulfotransferase family protein n=1 Tax=Rudaea sp. TaxID=2136325 RepID=UPI0039E32970